ncbi:MAG: 16S rRNA processing protein RimM [Acidimicrobiia bacterium]
MSRESHVSIPDGLLLVALVHRPHGVKGEVSVELVGENPGRLSPGSRLVAVRENVIYLEEVVVSASRIHRGRYIVRFSGFETRDEAETLRGVALCISEKDTRPHDHQVWIKDLYGLTVVDTKGRVLGVLTYPAQDVLEINTPAGRRLLPFVEQLVPNVDLDAGRIVVNPPLGVFDESGEDED